MSTGCKGAATKPNKRILIAKASVFAGKKRDLLENITVQVCLILVKLVARLGLIVGFI